LTKNLYFTSAVWNLFDYYQEKNAVHQRLSLELNVSLPSSGHLEPLNKKAKIDSNFFSRVCADTEIIKVMIALRKPFTKHIMPKSVLLNHVLKEKHEKIPVYHTEQIDKLFFSTVIVNNKQYANRYL